MYSQQYASPMPAFSYHLPTLPLLYPTHGNFKHYLEPYIKSIIQNHEELTTQVRELKDAIAAL